MEPQAQNRNVATLPPLVVDRHEAAAALRISLRKLDYLLSRGSIKTIRIDGRVVIAWAELCRFIEDESRAVATAIDTEK
jgi:hypothetical protein